MYYLRLARTYLHAEHRRMLTVGNTISVLGIFLGVLALMLVMSVMNGMEEDITNRIIGLHSEIKLYEPGMSLMENWAPRVTELQRKYQHSISPVFQTEGMLVNNQYVAGVICQGVHWDSHCAATRLNDAIFIGDPTEKSMENGIVVGSDLAAQLRVNWGDFVTLSSPIANHPTPFGLVPNTRKLKVVGLFYTGVPEYDMKYSFTDLEGLQNFANRGDRISFIEVGVNNPQKAIKIAEDFRKEYKNRFEILDWRQFERHLFAAIHMEKNVMFLVLILIFLVAGFNMMGNYLKMVRQKQENIGILKALGALPHDIVKIFLYNGIYIGLIGIISGFAVSFSLLFVQIKWEVIKIPLAGLPYKAIPVKIDMSDIMLVFFVALSICILTTVIPAYRTTKMNAISVLQHKD